MKLILLVEDELGQAEVMQLLLESEGYRVAITSSGREALESLKGEKPALILSDFMMPFMHGGELGIAVRSDDELFQVPFVFMSGTSEHVVRQTFADYDAFIPKPYEIASLLLLIAEMIEHGRPSRPKSEEIKKSMMRLLNGLELRLGVNAFGAALQPCPRCS